ncbi:MAG TPA: PIN domain-containing protein [Chloroflexota bacterium]
MPREVFIDAGAWIAIIDQDDQYYSAATEIYKQLLINGSVLVTTNLVIAEAYVIIRKRAGHTTAMRFLQSLRQTGRLLRVYADAALEEAAERILTRYADQDFSLADAVSFALMRQRGIVEAFAFDHHFLVAGFVLVPGST